MHICIDLFPLDQHNLENTKLCMKGRYICTGVYMYVYVFTLELIKAEKGVLTNEVIQILVIKMHIVLNTRSPN